jgi:hypothetical protein
MCSRLMHVASSLEHGWASSYVPVQGRKHEWLGTATACSQKVNIIV